MRPFDVIRSRVSAAEAYQRYVGPVQRNKALCIWHSDRHPSLSFKGAFCRCFACGGSGSAIDVVMRLYGLDVRGAAERINADFSLGLDFDGPIDVRAVAQARNDRAVIRSLEKWMDQAWDNLCHYRLTLIALENRYGPINIEAIDDPVLKRVADDLPDVERLLDLHQETWGSNPEAKSLFYKQHRPEVDRLVQRYLESAGRRGSDTAKSGQ